MPVIVGRSRCATDPASQISTGRWMRLPCPAPAKFFPGLCPCGVGRFQVQQEHQGEGNSDEGRECEFGGQYDVDANFDVPGVIVMFLKDAGFCRAYVTASIPQMGELFIIRLRMIEGYPGGQAHAGSYSEVRHFYLKSRCRF